MLGGISLYRADGGCIMMRQRSQHWRDGVKSNRDHGYLALLRANTKSAGRGSLGS
jgi:hypothetical protein